MLLNYDPFDPFRALERLAGASRQQAVSGMPMDVYRAGDHFESTYGRGFNTRGICRSPSHRFLIGKVVDNRPMKIRCNENDILDMIFVDESEQFGSLGRIALEPVFSVNDAKVLYRLGNDDKFPCDTVPPAFKQTVLKTIHLCTP